MKKNILKIVILFLLLGGCAELDELSKIDERRVVYNVDFKGVQQNFEYATTITYIDESGDTKFKDHQSAFLQWEELGGDFSKGDRVSLAINTSLDRGTITLTIICKDCNNKNLVDGKLKKTVDLTRIKVGELSFNVE
jgi:PBP1b-binding outer membrane lipoprotein LpoB